MFWITWLFQWPLSFLISSGYDAEDYVQKIHVPIVFVHSVKDPVVPYKFGRELFDKANEPKEFWEVQEPSHIQAFAYEESPLREKLVKFLDLIFQ